MPFRFERSALPGVLIAEPKVFADDRGFFMETYKRSEFAAAGIDETFVQENHSKSVRGTLRGLHLQRAPRAQGKLIRALRGEVFDVAVDIRPDSPTFRRWVSVTLSGDNRRSVYVPPGYAHGFCVLSDEAEVVYKTTEEYSPELEWGVRWDDPLLSIEWPISAPLLSERDARWPPLSALR
jgi:dTDP-4-dehydrorhamnose 3,5-epimerase